MCLHKPEYSNQTSINHVSKEPGPIEDGKETKCVKPRPHLRKMMFIRHRTLLRRLGKPHTSERMTPLIY